MFCFSVHKHIAYATLVSLALGGCQSLPLHSDPYLNAATGDSIVLSQQELMVLANNNDIGAIKDEGDRDRFVSLKMYLIDKAYFDYERRLTNEDVTINSLGAIGTLASTTVATAIPAGQATKALAAVATGLNGATSIYDDKVLLTKTIQALQIQMRSDRDTVAARIYARRRCNLRDYTIGLALSDLEAYARAGTFEAGLQGLTQSVSKAHDTAADLKDASLRGAGATSNLVTQANATAGIASTGPDCPLLSPNWGAPRRS